MITQRAIVSACSSTTKGRVVLKDLPGFQGLLPRSQPPGPRWPGGSRPALSPLLRMRRRGDEPRFKKKHYKKATAEYFILGVKICPCFFSLRTFARRFSRGAGQPPARRGPHNTQFRSEPRQKKEELLKGRRIIHSFWAHG